MKMLLLCLTVFFTGSVVAQMKVSGKVAAANGKPVAFANVYLLNISDTSLVKGAIANEMGEFNIDRLSSGKYFLRYSAAGFQTYNSPELELRADEENKVLATQVLEEDSRKMAEVVVKAEKPLYQQQMEGTIVNVKSSILSKGSSALEVLERSPGVFIDRQNNNIALNGKSGVMVMINGKLMRMSLSQVVTLLGGMSANNIERIELLTTPPAKYDAEGSAGLINIVLTKTKKVGTNGSFSVTGGYGWGEKGAGTFDITHRKGRIELFGTYSYSHDRSFTNWVAESKQNVPILGGEMTVAFWNTSKPVQDNHDATIGFATALNSKTSIGASIGYNNNYVSSVVNNQGEYNVLPDSLLRFNGVIKSTNRWTNYSSNFNLERRIAEGEKFNFDIDYLYYKNRNPTDVESSFLNKANIAAGNNDSVFAARQRGFANTTIQVGVVKADYVKQLNKKVKLEAGMKGTYTRNASFSGIESFVGGVWVKRPEASNDIVMNEGIAAAYTSFNVQIDEKTAFTAGVRYEYSQTRLTDNSKNKAEILNRKLGVFFPNLFYSRKLNENAELQLSYTKRISRPSYNDLASFVGYNDPVSVFTGNQSLRPTITNNIKIGYNYKRYSFSLLFSRDDNPISRFQLTENQKGDLMYVSPQNIEYQNNINFQTNLPFKVSSWWDMNYGFTGGLRQFKLKHTKEKFVKSYFGYSFYGSQSFKLPKQYFIELSGWYNSLSYNGSVIVDGFGALNLGVKKDFKNNNGSLQLSVTDILRTMQITSSYGQFTQEAFSLSSRLDFNLESRTFPIVKLTYSKSFGSNSGSSQRKQANAANDERGRVRKD
jgi:iron complex outermembrane recepter protein